MSLSCFNKFRRPVPKFIAVVFLLCFAAFSHGQLPSPDMGTPDRYQSQIGECQRLSMAEPAQAASLAQEFLSKNGLTPYATTMFTDCLAHAAVVAHDFKTAAATENRALLMLDKSNMPNSVQVNILSNAGGMFNAMGDTERAIMLLRQALGKSKGLPAARIAALMNMGSLYQDVQDAPHSADAYFQEAFDLSRSIGQEDVYIDFTYGDNLLRLKRYDEALQIMDRIALLGKDKEIYAGVRARADVTRAKIFLAKGNPQQAHKILNRVIPAEPRLSDPEGEADAFITLGQIQLQEKNDHAALSSAQCALNLGQKINSERIQLDAMHLIVSIDSAAGKPVAALAMAQRANAMEVSELKAQNVKSLASYESQLKDQAVQYQNEQLRAEAELQTLRIKRARQSRDLLIGLLVLLVSAGSVFLLYQRRVSRKLHELSTTDPLCGLLNRREAARILSEYRHTPGLAAVRRTSLFLIDVDHFKLVNDKHGHDAGDHVLTELCARLTAVCRPDDLVARWGGEEFLIGAGNLTFQEATGFAERLRIAVESEQIQLPDTIPITVTVSIGFASYPFFPSVANSTWKETIYLADRALYSAKNSGRNAWAGMWGALKTAGVSIRTIHDDPEQAVANGWTEVSTNKKTVWHMALEPTDLRANDPRPIA